MKDHTPNRTALRSLNLKHNHLLPVGSWILNLLAAVLLLAGTSALQAGDGSWCTNAAGNWPDAFNWTNGIVPNAVGDTANFTNDISASRTISLNGDKTVGNLNLGDSVGTYFGFNINAGSPFRSKLIFDQAGVADANVNILNFGGAAANNLSLYYVQLNDNLVINATVPNSNTVQLACSAIISENGGSFSVTKTGPGIIALSAPNTHSGGVNINAGRVNVNTLTALGSGTAAVASGGQAFLNSQNVNNNFSIAGTGYANSVDGSAQAGAIRMANNRVIFGNVTVSSAARIGADTNATGFINGNLLGSANLEINGAATTNGTISLLGSGSGYSGTLSLTRGNFNFGGAFGGSIAAAPVAGAASVLWAGTSIAGNLSLDSTAATATIRNPKGTLAITGNLNLTGASAASPASFPAPGVSTLTLMTYASAPGAGTLTFNATSYRGTPTLAVGAASAVISGLDTRTLTWGNTSADGTWNVNSSANWTGGDTKFFSGDAVVFGDTAAGTVTLSGTLKPHSITFNNTGANAYVLSGATGVIDGADAGISLNGTGLVTLGGTNTFTGPVAVNQGRLILGTAGALGYTSGLTVAGGAALDLNGQKLTAASRAVDVTIAGSGDGTVPALGNKGATIGFAGSASAGIRNVTLSADATIGGATNFDICGVLDAAYHTLTKAGPSQVYLLGPIRNLTNLVVAGGILSAYNVIDPFGSNVRIESGASIQIASGGTYSSRVTMASGAKLDLSTGTEARWTGPIIAEGNVEFANQNVGTTYQTFVQDMSIPGNLTKSGNGSIALLGNVTVAGNLNNPTGLATLYVGDGITTNSLTVIGAGGTGAGNANLNMSSGTTLRGVGKIPGTANVNSGATIAPGTNSAVIANLTFNALTFNGNLVAKIDKTVSPSNDLVTVAGTLAGTSTGTITLTNLPGSPTFVEGDTFQLFSKPYANGAGMTIIPASPGAGLVWYNTLALDGAIHVVNPTNAHLADLVVTPPGALVPAFDPNTTTYSVAEDNINNYVTVTPTAASVAATNLVTYQVTTYQVPSGTASPSFLLDSTPGITNVIQVQVVALDGVTTKTYELNIVRAPSTNALLSYLDVAPPGALNPAFDPNTFAYTATEDYANTPVTVTAYAADATATILVSCAGVTNPVVALNANPGIVNVIDVHVTAQDTVTQHHYLVNVTRLPSQTNPSVGHSAAGGFLTLTWPLENTGYRLLEQTNHAVAGISANTNDWAELPGYTTTNTAVLPIVTTNKFEFFRLVYP